MAKTTRYDSVKGVNRALSRVPDRALSEVEQAQADAAARIAQEAAGRARATGGAATLVAGHIRAAGPSVVMDGAGQIRPGPRQTIGDVMWGAEFGGSQPQFNAYRAGGYFLWPTMRERLDGDMEAYGDALGDALDGVK